jgi:hypothetical protein
VKEVQFQPEEEVGRGRKRGGHTRQTKERILGIKKYYYELNISKINYFILEVMTKTLLVNYQGHFQHLKLLELYHIFQVIYEIYNYHMLD